MEDGVGLQFLFGLTPVSEKVQAYISTLTSSANTPFQRPEVKTYPDAVYFNYFNLGLSFLFIPTKGYRPKAGAKLEQLDQSLLYLHGVDIYNVPKQKLDTQTIRAPSNAAYSTYPISPIALRLSACDKDGKPRSRAILEITDSTAGKEFVSVLGEPDRKGGGSGPSSGSIGIWLEWKKDGLMVEFGGDESRGPQAWEKGKDALWSVLSISPPSE